MMSEEKVRRGKERKGEKGRGRKRKGEEKKGEKRREKGRKKGRQGRRQGKEEGKARRGEARQGEEQGRRGEGKGKGWEGRGGEGRGGEARRQRYNFCGVLRSAVPFLPYDDPLQMSQEMLTGGECLISCTMCMLCWLCFFLCMVVMGGHGWGRPKTTSNKTTNSWLLQGWHSFVLLLTS